MAAAAEGSRSETSGNGGGGGGGKSSSSLLAVPETEAPPRLPQPQPPGELAAAAAWRAFLPAHLSMPCLWATTVEQFICLW